MFKNRPNWSFLVGYHTSQKKNGHFAFGSTIIQNGHFWLVIAHAKWSKIVQNDNLIFGGL